MCHIIHVEGKLKSNIQIWERERERERDYLMVVMWKIEWLILTIYYVGERLMKNEISSLYKNWLLMIIQYTYIILFLLNNLGFQMSWNSITPQLLKFFLKGESSLIFLQTKSSFGRGV